LRETLDTPAASRRTHGFLDRAAPWILAAVLLIYFAVALRVLRARPLWNDEIFTIYLCRLPDMASVWRALKTGLEQMPPFWHVVSRAAYTLAGGGAFAIRLPALLGFTVMCICIYVFLVRRLPRSFALLGALAPFVTGALRYGYEGRSYGVVYGCAGIAIVAWQAAHGRYRWPALVVLTLSCAAAISSHYYAVLVLIPLGMGELVRNWQARRIDKGVWGALILSLVPLLFFAPLVLAARSYSHSFWSRPGLTSVSEAYVELIAFGFPLLAALALFWLACLVLRRARVPENDRARSLPDLMVMIGFLAVPLAMTGLSFMTHAFVPRYGFWGVIGIGLGVGYATYFSGAGSRVIAGLTLTGLLAGFALTQGYEVRRLSSYRVEALDPLEPVLAAGLPVVYASPVDYLQAAYYAPPQVNRRLVYIADPAIALRLAGSDSAERALILLARMAPLHVETFDEFTTHARRFVVIESGELGWIVPELAARGATVRVMSSLTAVRTYEVSFGRQ